MHDRGVAFGERIVVLGDAPVTLPARVLLPGPGVTVAERADRAFNPTERARRTEAINHLGMLHIQQDQVDIPSADRICPPTTGTTRYAAATLTLGRWRHRLAHCPPGPELAALLDDRPEDLAPAPGQGEVTAVVTRLPGPHGEVTVTTHTAASGSGLAPMPAEPQRWPRVILDSIIARNKLISHLQARQYADIAALSGCYPGIHQYLATELALALHTTDADAAALLGAAEALRDRLPDTRQALAEGRIDDAKAMALLRATATTSPDIAHTVEQRVLPDAERMTSTAVRRRAGRAVIAADPDGAADRHRRAVRERHVWRAPDEDGMARLGVYAPAQDVDAIWRAITAVADAIKRPGESRGLGERRSDALTMVCTDILAAGGWARLKLPDKGHARPRINVTVPYTALLGQRTPCELVGHGPITTEQALPLIGAGDLYRMLCDPASGMLLDYGHTRYRPPPHLAAFVRARDGECPMPSCHHPAQRGHLDHIIPARPDPHTGKPTHGVTSADNLAPPCPHHHLGKDAGRGFTLHRAHNGTYTWTTPLGYTYTWRPDPLWHPTTDPHTASPDLGDAPVCDCPDTCACQQSPTPTPAATLVPLTIDGDWADGYFRPPGSASTNSTNSTSTSTSTRTNPKPTVNAEAAWPDPDPPPF